MLLPIKTDYQSKRIPWVNYSLIATNIFLFIYLYIFKSGRNDALYSHYIYKYMLNLSAPNFMQFFTSLFLHADWEHLLGNMLFLWVFGNAINDKLGQIGYLIFYLAGGVAASLGYYLLNDSGYLIGASGAIAAVTGAYFIMLPRTNVYTILFAIIIMPLEISSLIFIACQVALNIYWTLSAGQSQVAHSAHVAGYLFGMIIAIGLLKIGIIRRDDWDILHLIKRFRQRSKYRKFVKNNYDPFARSHEIGKNISQVSERMQKNLNLDSNAFELYNKINDACRNDNPKQAAELYLQWENLEHADVVLTEKNLLIISNAFTAEQKFESAASCYEQLLEHYPNCDNNAQIRLMLGRVYNAYLNMPEKALAHLQIAEPKLRGQQNTKMCRDEIQDCKNKIG